MNYGIHLLGNDKFTMVGAMYDINGQSSIGIGNAYNYVDNLYLQYAIHYGSLYMLTILIISSAVLFYMCKHKVPSTVLLLFALMLLVSLIDDGMLKLPYNLFLILVAEVMWGSTNNSYYKFDLS